MEPSGTVVSCENWYIITSETSPPHGNTYHASNHTNTFFFLNANLNLTQVKIYEHAVFL